MKKKIAQYWHIIIAGAVNVFVIIAIVLVCTPGRDFSADGGEDIRRIGICFPSRQDEYLREVEDMIRSSIELRGDLVFSREGGSTGAHQEEELKALLEKDLDDLLLCPASDADLDDLLTLCRVAKVRVILAEGRLGDSDQEKAFRVAEGGSPVAYEVYSDDYDAGEKLADYLLTRSRNAHILLLGRKSSSRSERREDGFTDHLRENSGASVTRAVQTVESMEDAMSCVEEACRDRLSFDTIFAADDTIAAGAYAGLKHNSRTGSVTILSVGGSPDGKRMVSEGKIAADAALFPDLTASGAVGYLYGENGSGNYGVREVPVKLITKYNIDSYDIDSWEQG